MKIFMYFIGYCIDNSSIPQCKCYKHYFGTNCEIKSEALRAIKTITTCSLTIACLAISLFITIIISMDVINFINWLKKP